MKPQASRVLTEHLSQNSSPYHDPISVLPWETLSLDDYWLPRQAMSLYGLPEFDKLDEIQKIRVSQYEFISFIQAGIWLEGLFMQRLVKAVRHTTRTSERIYHLHELREEAGHSLMFLELIRRSGLAIPKLKRQWPFFADLCGRYLPHRNALFWMAVVIGEEVPDKLNRQIRHQADDGLNPVIREMSTLHIKDEARHIAYSRNEVTELLRVSRVHYTKWFQPLLNTLFNQFVTRFYFPHPAYYEYAGLENGNAWRAKAMQNPARQQFIEQCVTPTVRFFQEHGIELKLNFR